MFNNSTTVGSCEILSHLARLAEMKPRPTWTAKKLVDAIDKVARAKRDAGDKARAGELFAIRDCIDAVAGVKDALDAAEMDIATLDIEQVASRAQRALADLRYAIEKMVFA